MYADDPAGTTRWINVEIEFRTTSRPYFNYISTLFQRQMPAGDAVIFSQSETGLQNMLDKLNVYCKMWNLKVNVNKNKGDDF